MVQPHAHALASWVDPIDCYAFGSRATMRTQFEGVAACLVHSQCSDVPIQGGRPLFYSLLLWRFGAGAVESNDGYGWCRSHPQSGGCDGISHILRGNIRGRCYYLNGAPEAKFYHRDVRSAFRITDARLHATARCLGLEPRSSDDERNASESVRMCKRMETYGDFFGNMSSWQRNDPTPWDRSRPLKTV